MRLVLVVLSPRAVASDWVRKDVSSAVKNRPRRLIPLLLRKCHFPTLHQQLEAIQYVDYRGRIGIARGRLLAVWNRSMLPVSRLYEAVRIIQLVLRGVYWRLKRVAWCCGGIVTACILLVVGALLWVQGPGGTSTGRRHTHRTLQGRAGR